MKIYNQTRNSLIASEVVVADTLLSRTKGLLARKNLSPQEGLLITRCKSIHMIFMQFAIDVIFADKENRVVGLNERLQPFQLSPIYFKSSYAIEVPEGAIAKSETSLGDQLILKD